MGKSGKKVRIPRMTREKLISFLPDQFPEPEVFFVELTGVTYPDARYRIDREHSTVLCLEYVISGTGHVETGPHPFHPCAGSVYALPPGLHHRYYADARDPWEKIWVNVRGSLCEELLRLYGFEQPVYAPDCPALPLFEELAAVCEAPPQDRYVFERRCTLLVHEILLLVRGALRTSFAREPSPAERAKDLLDKSLSKPLSVEELAEEICLSPSRACSARLTARRLTAICWAAVWRRPACCCAAPRCRCGRSLRISAFRTNTISPRCSGRRSGFRRSPTGGRRTVLHNLPVWSILSILEGENPRRTV